MLYFVPQVLGGARWGAEDWPGRERRKAGIARGTWGRVERTWMAEELTPAERREVERHKYFLSLERGYDVGFDCAREDWLHRYAATWRQARHRQMLALQRDEINRFKWIESEKARRDLGRDAALEWIRRYAKSWRDWYEKEYDGSARRDP